MSRTKKGSKNGTYEYWSRRPFSTSPPSKWIKKKTHRIERLQAKQACKEE